MQVKNIEEIVDKVSAILPEGLQGIKTDFESNVRAVLRNAFSKLDLVTREEFEVQSQVLSRTREKLEALQKQVTEIEKLLEEKNS